MESGKNISQDFGPVFMEPGEAAVEKITASLGPRAPGPESHSEERPITTATDDQIDDVSDDELLAEAGVEVPETPDEVSQTVTTGEAAEYFNRTTQWLYYILGTGRITDEQGNRLQAIREGTAGGVGRRVFDMDLLTEILKANYRQGNVEPEELKLVLRRIRMTRNGIEWREREGWRRVPVTRYRHRWVPPEKAELVDGQWALKPEFKAPSRSTKTKESDD